MSSIGEKIYKLRSERGLTLEELAQKIGVGKSPTLKGRNITILSQIQHLWLTSWLTRT